MKKYLIIGGAIIGAGLLGWLLYKVFFSDSNGSGTGTIDDLDGTWTDEESFASPHTMTISGGNVIASAGGSSGQLILAGTRKLTFGGLTATFTKNRIVFSSGIIWTRV